MRQPHRCLDCEHLEKPLWCDGFKRNQPDYEGGHIVTIENCCPKFKPKKKR